MPHESVISARQVYRRFGPKQVLRGVDLDIPRGSVVGLLGQNASGKTTLIKCLLGLLRIDSGQLEVFGENSWWLTANAKARIGYVPQDIVLYDWMCVEQMIAYTAAFYPHWNEKLVERLTSTWQVPLYDRIGLLSAGQLQKLAILLAMGHEPDLLILDEPVAGLDPVARRDFLRAILEIAEDADRTVLFSTHITSDLERVASRAAILRDGRIVFHDELDVLKDTVKRLRITAPFDLPRDLSIRGALHMEVAGPTALVAVAGVTDRLITELRSSWNASVDIEHLSLEDIFLEMHRGRYNG
jgi:ABC-2 type transport system ATP-binding protein